VTLPPRVWYKEDLVIPEGVSVSLTFRLVIDSNLPTERKEDAHLQVGADKPQEEPLDIEVQIFVNRSEYS
jgi:hypothetical protein